MQGLNTKNVPTGVRVTDAGAINVALVAGSASAGSVIIASNAMELYGASTATRPLATAVPIGTSFTVVAATIVVYLSDGTQWIEV